MQKNLQERMENVQQKSEQKNSKMNEMMEFKPELLEKQQQLEELFEKKGRRWPVFISVTITDNSGRTLSGQTLEAFWYSVRHIKPILVGINCALGASEMRPFVEQLAQIADTFVACYPNAGLPNPLSDTGYDETPEITAGLVKEFADAGLVNLVGGCCGTTPPHIKAIVEAISPYPMC